MDERRDPAITLPWMEEGTRRLVDLCDGLPDADFAAPSLLPGWSRAHVVAHAALNAEALGRLVHWAATGEETPMYRSLEQREADIVSTAALTAPALRERLRDESTALADALDSLTPDGWAATVRTREGREMPAAEIPWMRVREVWVHAVDLDAGADFGALPPTLAATLLAEVARRLTAMAGCPAVLLKPLDAGPVSLGPEGAGRTRVRGGLGDLLHWVTGRGDGAGLAALSAEGDHVALPGLPAWL